MNMWVKGLVGALSKILIQLDICKRGRDVCVAFDDRDESSRKWHQLLKGKLNYFGN